MDFDAIVVGGGAAGGAITWQLARGLKVACLGASHGCKLTPTRRQRLTGNCRSAAPSHRYRLMEQLSHR